MNNPIEYYNFDNPRLFPSIPPPSVPVYKAVLLTLLTIVTSNA